MQAWYILSYIFCITALEILIDAASWETWKVYKMLQNYLNLSLFTWQLDRNSFQLNPCTFVGKLHSY